MDTIGEEEIAGGGVVEFTAIVTLDAFNGTAKLRRDISKEMRKSSKSVRFKSKRKHPSEVGAVIKNYKIVFITRNARNGRSPKITMY